MNPRRTNKKALLILNSFAFSVALAVSAILFAGAQANAKCNELISGFREPNGTAEQLEPNYWQLGRSYLADPRDDGRSRGCLRTRYDRRPAPQSNDDDMRESDKQGECR